MSTQQEDIFTWRTKELRRWWFGANREERESMINSKNQLPKPKLPTLAEASAWKESVIASIEARSIRQNNASGKPHNPTKPEAQRGRLKRDQLIYPSASKVFSQLNGNGR